MRSFPLKSYTMAAIENQSPRNSAASWRIDWWMVEKLGFGRFWTFVVSSSRSCCCWCSRWFFHLVRLGRRLVIGRLLALALVVFMTFWSSGITRSRCRCWVSVIGVSSCRRLVCVPMQGTWVRYQERRRSLGRSYCFGSCCGWRKRSWSGSFTGVKVGWWSSSGLQKRVRGSFALESPFIPSSVWFFHTHSANWYWCSAANSPKSLRPQPNCAHSGPSSLHSAATSDAKSQPWLCRAKSAEEAPAHANQATSHSASTKGYTWYWSSLSSCCWCCRSRGCR